MAKATTKLTVRNWVHGPTGDYIPLLSLPPDKLAAFRRQTAERIAAEFQRCVNERPELLNMLREN